MQCWQNQLWLWLHGRVQVAPVARAVRRRWQQQRNDNNGSSMDDSGSSDGLLEPFRNQSMGEGLHSRWPSERKAAPAAMNLLRGLTLCRGPTSRGMSTHVLLEDAIAL